MAVTALQCRKSSFRKRRVDESSHLGALLSRDFASFDGRNSRRELESFSAACTRHYDLGGVLTYLMLRSRDRLLSAARGRRQGLGDLIRARSTAGFADPADDA